MYRVHNLYLYLYRYTYVDSFDWDYADILVLTNIEYLWSLLLFWTKFSPESPCWSQGMKDKTPPIKEKKGVGKK